MNYDLSEMSISALLELQLLIVHEIQKALIELE